MIAINKRSPTSIHVGTINVVKVMVGNVQVWPSITGTIYLNVYPTSIDLNESNNNTNIINVESNTDWDVKEID
jgi:hypothetical protein